MVLYVVVFLGEWFIKIVLVVDGGKLSKVFVFCRYIVLKRSLRF